MKRVLIVEDDPPIAMLERRILEEAGFLVEEVRRGHRALESIEESGFSLMVLDYRLPDMTGAEVVAALGERIRTLPIIMVSGYSEPELIHELLRAGVVEFLVKDTNLDFLEQLPQAVTRALARRL